jgi:hypothetical protein
MSSVKSHNNVMAPVSFLVTVRQWVRTDFQQTPVVMPNALIERVKMMSIEVDQFVNSLLIKE